jgi:hypothetical protein
MDEFFDEFGEQHFKSTAFYTNETEFFDDLLNISNTKHFKNLQYLAGVHAHSVMKLRFIRQPFSFLFLFIGDKKYHVIWETLNTKEATYIWHVPKNLAALKSSIGQIENIINTMKVQGKMAYLNSYTQDFKRIQHDYSNLKEGFIKWKAELESVMA